MAKPIAVFDVCGTLTKTNNTMSFTYYALRNNNIRLLLFKILVLFEPIISFFHYITHSKTDFVRYLAIKLFRGLSVTDIEKKADLYVKQLFKQHLINNKVIDLLSFCRGKMEIIFISQSISMPIQALAKQLNIKFFESTQLEEHDGKYTGKIKMDVNNNKVEILAKITKLIRKPIIKSLICTDNVEDYNLVKLFKDKYIVINNSQQNLFWKSRKNNMRFRYVVLFDDDNQIHSIETTDASSVTVSNYRYVYIPTVYYIISRLHFSGLLWLIIKQIIPLSIYLSFTTSQSLLISTVHAFFVYIIFFGIYEIGGLFNDLNSETMNNKNSTNRISKGVNINFQLFVIIRLIILVIVPLITFILRGIYQEYYVMYLLLLLCMFVYMGHTLLPKNIRLITFILLKTFRAIIPALILPTTAAIIVYALALFLDEGVISIYYYSIRKTYLQNRIRFLENPILRYLMLIIIGVCVYIFTNSEILLIYYLFLLVVSIGGKITETLFFKYKI